MEPLKKSLNVLFIYVQEWTEDFWVYDGANYHRFAWKEGCIRYVRLQASLPAYCRGGCIQVSAGERQVLEQEAARHALALVFSGSETACIQRIQRLHSEQHIFDRAAPAGYFYLGEWNRPHRSWEGEER